MGVTMTSTERKTPVLCTTVKVAGFCMLVLSAALPPAYATEVRIKDVAQIQGVRDNPVYGYGLVVGLNGTGDKRQTIFTTQSLANMLERQGITVPASAIKVNNVAAVMVTANLPPFARAGGRIPLTVSSVGDAQSLQGGILLLTPLRGADNQVYVSAQGPLVISGYSAGGNQSRVQSNHPTVGRIAEGGIIEKELANPIGLQGTLTYLLRQEDFTTARHLIEAINAHFSDKVAEAVDSRTVNVRVPESQRSNLVQFISDIEGLKLQTDAKAKVILNEKTGTVVMGKDVRMAAVAVIHGNLTVQIQTDLEVSQPTELSQGGKTEVVPRQTTTVKEAAGRQIQLKEGASVEEVVRALINVLGATPRDVIAILQAIHAAGALPAELEII
jgi:flagellar P-ring protein precursor FlgI